MPPRKKAEPKGCAAGHPGCKCTLMCCTITKARGEEIRAEATSGTHWVDAAGSGPACTCGVKPESGHSSVLGIRVERKCYRHG